MSLQNTINFLVSEKSFSIEIDKILTFPIKNTFLSVLIQNKTFKINTKSNHFIIDKCEYFQKIIDIYNNPNITLPELLQKDFDSFLNSQYEESNSIFIRKNYKNFIQELNYFGLYSLFFQNEMSFDLDIIYKTLQQKINIPDRVEENSIYVHKCYAYSLISKLKSVGGYFSGSFLLKTILNEKWENSDIDLFVNKHMLFGVFEKELQFIDKNLIKYPCKTDIGISDELKYFGQILADYFEADTDSLKIINKNDPTNYYGKCEKLSFVIKFTINKVNFDLIVVENSVPVFISNFDFSFNKIYYDGYSLHIFNENSLLKRKTLYNIYDYSKNIERIKKYFQRGFITIVQPY